MNWRIGLAILAGLFAIAVLFLDTKVDSIQLLAVAVVLLAVAVILPLRK